MCFTAAAAALTVEKVVSVSLCTLAWSRRMDPLAFHSQYRSIAVAATRGWHAFRGGRVAELLSSTSFHANALGIEFGARPCAAKMREQAVLDLVNASAGDRVTPIMFQLDYLTPEDACTQPWDDPHSSQLRDRGWVGIDDWGLDLQALQAQSTALLANLTAGNHKVGVLSIKQPQMPALEPLLANVSVARLLERYLGGPVRYEGHVLLHIGEDTHPSSYVSALWHHDRCGRRLKLFIFLHDVAEDGRPTLISEGTHGTWYYHTAVLGVSRFSPEYALKSGRVVPMVGRAGGGFIFDTNALHRGMHQGNHTRTTLVLEFHRHAKVAALRSKGYGGPCPSINQHSEQALTGAPGYPLYPAEAVPT